MPDIFDLLSKQKAIIIKEIDNFFIFLDRTQIEIKQLSTEYNKKKEELAELDIKLKNTTLVLEKSKKIVEENMAKIDGFNVLQKQIKQKEQEIVNMEENIIKEKKLFEEEKKIFEIKEKKINEKAQRIQQLLQS
jgi:hypothetical protein